MHHYVFKIENPRYVAGQILSVLCTDCNKIVASFRNYRFGNYEIPADVVGTAMFTHEQKMKIS